MLISFEVPLEVLFGITFLFGTWVGAYVSRECAKGKQLREEHEASSYGDGSRGCYVPIAPKPQNPKLGRPTPPLPEHNPNK